MKPMASNFLTKMVCVGCFPTLSVLFVGLGLFELGGIWAAVTASVMYFFLGIFMIKIVLKHPLLKSSAVPYVFWLVGLIGSLLLPETVGMSVAARALSGLVLLLVPILLLIYYFLTKKKVNLFGRLESHTTYVWLIFVSSAAVPASMVLTRLNNVLSLIPIIIYVVVFGWFGPEVVARVTPREGGLLLIPLFFFFGTLVFYGIMETLNPALKYQTPDSFVVVTFSYLACYTMLVSRCMLDYAKSPRKQKKLKDILKLKQIASYSDEGDVMKAEQRKIYNLHETEALKRIYQLSIDVIYDRILAWLSKEKAKIKRQDKPYYIRAEHGSVFVPFGHRRGAKKIIHISLYPNADYTVLHVAIDKKWYYKYYSPGVHSDMIVRLLANLNVESATIEDLYGSAILKEDEAFDRKERAVGSILLVCGVASCLIGVGFNGKYDYLLVLAFIFIFYGIIFFLVGYKRMKTLESLKQGNWPIYDINHSIR